jgi:predicted nucleic acid-binding Zn ribbon protein
MNTTDRTMIRRTEVTMTRDPRMPFYGLACPFCGSAKNVTRDGEHDCEKCHAPLQALKPRKS